MTEYRVASMMLFAWSVAKVCRDIDSLQRAIYRYASCCTACRIKADTIIITV